MRRQIRLERIWATNVARKSEIQGSISSKCAHDCMDAGGRVASGTATEKMSGTCFRSLSREAEFISNLSLPDPVFEHIFNDVCGQNIIRAKLSIKILLKRYIPVFQARQAHPFLR